MRGSRNHGYGGHRAESFARYYKRSVLSEGCSCSERVLDPSNRPGAGGALLGLLFLIPAALCRAWRAVARR
jgi:hypothetical protein